MKLSKLPSLLLAVALQIVPVCRVASVNQAVIPNGFAILFRWVAGAGVLLDTYDAVSASSAYVAGLQNLSPVGPLTVSATGTVGQVFLYRIIVNNAGQNPLQAFYDATGLPPGLTINTNLAANGGTNQIKGTPLSAGVFPVTLIAGNSLYTNTVSTNVTITISGTGTGTAPSITTQPQPVSVTNGGNASFWVVAAGTAPLSYQWHKDGTNLLGATSATNNLTAVTTNDAGGYSVVVTNASGSITSQVATLTVLPPPIAPSITTQPQPVLVTNGGNASFWVVAAGTAPLSYQWHKDGTNLLGATSATNNLTAVTTNDAGGYSVVVTNASGSITSQVATLTVLPPPIAPSITTQPQPVLVTNGGNASFWVVAAGTAPLSYQWRKDGTNLLGATSATNNLTAVTTNDAGGYSVVVTNASGSITSQVATLTVLPPPIAPSITTQPQPVSVTNGGNASFWVVAAGTAPLSYQWHKDGTNLLGATGATNNLTAATTNDAGGYSVVVTNASGSITSQVATLTILPSVTPPVISAPPTNTTVVAGQPATFYVTATGAAPLTYQWWVSANPLLDATNASLALNNVRLSQAGDYSVVVTNSAGAVTSGVAHLTVDLPAAPLVNVLPPQDNQFILSFVPIVGLTNTVLTAATLDSGSWTVLTNIPPPATAASISITDIISGASSFYRVSVSP